VRPFAFFYRLVSPLRFLVEGVADAILRLFGGGSLGADWGALSEREFRALVDVVEEEGELDEGERELIHNIFDLAERRAGEIMTPLADVFMVPAAQSWEGLLAEVRRFRRSRIPVYGEGRQDVVGILHFKELLEGIAVGAPPADWRTLLAEPYVVPTSIRLPLLLKEFRLRKNHFALVADEYGDVAGIVTLEDVLEELFGEIREEHDREVEEIVPRPDGSFRVQGRTPVEHFNDFFSTSIPDEEWDTVAGFLLHEFGRLPARGDAVHVGDLVLTVERLKGIRIVRIRVGKERRAVPRGEGKAVVEGAHGVPPWAGGTA
jgi:CBS domain containing-hemolysin-like protein